MNWLLIALAGAGLATTGLQSSDELIDQAGAAFQAGNADEAIRLAEQAVAAADGPGDRFNALIVFGDLRRETGDPGTAYELYARAVEVVETHAPDNVAALELALNRQASAALEDGRREDWIAIGERAAALNRIAEEPVWRFEDNMQVRHRFSALPCPANAEGYVRAELISYDGLGTDVSCRYELQGGPPVVVTVHSFLTHATRAEAYDAARQGLLRNMSEGHLVEDGETEIGGVPVDYGIWRQQGTTAAVWTSQRGAWTLKLRLTHYGGLDRDDLDAAARLAFAGAADIDRHLAQCEALDGDGAFQRSDAPGTALEAMLSTLTSTSTGDEIDALECFLGEAEFRPSGGRMLARISDAGEVIDYRAHPRDTQSVYIVAEPGSGTLGLLSRATGDADPARPWMLRQVSEDGEGPYGTFSARPSPDAFRSAIAAILAGEVELEGWITTDEDGNSTVTLIDEESR